MLKSVQSINSSNIIAVAKMMSKIKPEFWDEEGAVEQLEDCLVMAKLLTKYGRN